VHLDLYRLTQPQANGLLLHTADYSGIRCIEWFDKLRDWSERKHVPLIHIAMHETSASERSLQCRFHDAVLPSDREIAQWRRDVQLPAHICAHCDVVAHVCDGFAHALLERGQIVRTGALHRAAQVHDLFRFLDFRPGGHPDTTHSPGTIAHWTSIRSRYPGLHHEVACAEYLRERGFTVLADIVAVHGLAHPPAADAAVEQKLLFYADKRVLLDRVVTLDERFADFAKRYGKGSVSDEAKRWYEMTKRVEEELFPGGPPV